MIKEITDENQEKGEQKQKDEARIYSPGHLLPHKAKRRPHRGTTAAKPSPPLGDRSGIADTGAPKEARTGASEELGTGAAEELSTKATKELNIGASEEAGTGASKEPIPDVRLLQKDQD